MRHFRIILNTVQANGRTFKFFLLGSLYFTQMLPLGFVFSGLTIIMRKAGYSLEDIAYLFVIGLPHMIKFLWAPLIDRGAGKPNHYKKIVLAMTICYAIAAAIASQIDPVTNLPVLVVLLTVAMGFLATQDIAVDAMATRMLAPEERGVGNGIQAAGAFCGYFIGGGVMLILFDSIGGWGNSILLLTSLLVLALIPLLFFKEKGGGEAKSRAKLKDIFTFFKNKQILPMLIVAMMAGVFLEVSYRKMRPLLTDANFSMKEIGLYLSIIGMASGIISSLLFGFLMKRFGLRKGFLASVGFALLAFPALMFPALNYLSQPYILAAVLLGGACSGAIHATVYALYMDNGREGKEGTDFTVQSALSFFIANGAAVLFGRLADKQGYFTLFLVAGILHFIFVIVAFFIVRGRKNKDKVIEVMQAEIVELAESESTSL